MKDKISVHISPNEKGSTRATDLAKAIAEDTRFSLPGFIETGIDLQFITEEICQEPGCIDGHNTDYQNCLNCGGTGIEARKFNIELKEPADYIFSALGKQGHLYQQILTMREAGDPCMVLVLGSDKDISDAIHNALKTRYRGQELHFQLASYEDRLIDLESNAEALGCPVRRWKSQAWRRLLSTSHKILTGGNLAGYRPRPADGERDITALNCLWQGIGPEIAKTILLDYEISLTPKPGARELDKLPGIGPKRAKMIEGRIRA